MALDVPECRLLTMAELWLIPLPNMSIQNTENSSRLAVPASTRAHQNDSASLLSRSSGKQQARVEPTVIRAQVSHGIFSTPRPFCWCRGDESRHCYAERVELLEEAFESSLRREYHIPTGANEFRAAIGKLCELDGPLHIVAWVHHILQPTGVAPPMPVITRRTLNELLDLKFLNERASREVTLESSLCRFARIRVPLLSCVCRKAGIGSVGELIDHLHRNHHLSTSEVIGFMRGPVAQGGNHHTTLHPHIARRVWLAKHVVSPSLRKDFENTFGLGGRVRLYIRAPRKPPLVMAFRAFGHRYDFLLNPDEDNEHICRSLVIAHSCGVVEHVGTEQMAASIRIFGMQVGTIEINSMDLATSIASLASALFAAFRAISEPGLPTMVHALVSVVALGRGITTQCYEFLLHHFERLRGTVAGLTSQAAIPFDLAAIVLTVVSLFSFNTLPSQSHIAKFAKTAATVGTFTLGVTRTHRGVTELLAWAIDKGFSTLCGISLDEGPLEQLRKEVNDVRATLADLERERNLQNVIYCRRVKALNIQFSEIYTVLNGSALPSEVTQTMQHMRLRIRALHDEVMASGIDAINLRTEPVVVCFRGDPGAGKTQLAMEFARKAVAHLCDGVVNPANDIYVRNSAQHFWDGYKSHVATIYDDFGQMVDTVNKPNVEFLELIKTQNQMPYPLPMASIEQKANTYFTSRFIALTTNMEGVRVKSLVSDAAVARRIELDLKVVPLVFDGDGNVQMTHEGANPNWYQYVCQKTQRIYTASELLTELLKRLDEKRERAERVYARFSAEGPVDASCFSEWDVLPENAVTPIEVVTDPSDDCPLDPPVMFADDPPLGERAVPQGFIGEMGKTLFPVVSGDDHQDGIHGRNRGLVSTLAHLGRSLLSPYVREELIDVELDVFNLAMRMLVRIAAIWATVKVVRLIFNQFSGSSTIKCVGVAHEGLKIGALVEHSHICVACGDNFQHKHVILHPSEQALRGPLLCRRCQRFKTHSSFAAYGDAAFAYDNGQQYEDAMRDPGDWVSPGAGVGASGGVFEIHDAVPVLPKQRPHSFDLEDRRRKNPPPVVDEVVTASHDIEDKRRANERPLTDVVEPLSLVESSIFKRVVNARRAQRITRAEDLPAGIPSLAFEEAVETATTLYDAMVSSVPLRGLTKEAMLVLSHVALLESELLVRAGCDIPFRLRVEIAHNSLSPCGDVSTSRAILARCAVAWCLSERESVNDSNFSDVFFFLKPQQVSFARHLFLGVGGDASDEGGLVVSHMVRNNIYQIYSEESEGGTLIQHIFFVAGRVALINTHSVDRLRSIKRVTLCSYWGERKTFRVCDLFIQPLLTKRTNDLTLIVFPREMRDHVDVRKHFIRATDVAAMSEVPAVLIGMKNINGVITAHDRSTLARYESTRTYGEASNERFGAVYTYELNTVGGDCGSILVAHSTTLARKILGFHCYGWAAIQGGAFVVTEGDLQAACEIVKKNFPGAMSALPVAQGATGVHSSGLWTFDRDLPPGLGGNTSIRRSKLDYKEPETAPAHLRPVGGRDPFDLALQKCRASTVFIDPDRVRRAVCHYKKRLFSHPLFRTYSLLGVLTLSMALTGTEHDFVDAINRSTSPGYPFCLDKHQRGGKYPWVDDNFDPTDELIEMIAQRELAAKRGERTRTLWKDTLKDERRDIPRVNAIKTRLFSAGPIDYLVILRMYFLSFAAYVMRSRIDNEIAIGIDVNTEWYRLSRYLHRNGNNMIAGDFSNFDATLNEGILWGVLDIINDFYDDGEENALVRSVLWREITNSSHILPSGIVYSQDHGNPSGNALTSVINSIYNSICARLVYMDIFGGTLDGFDEGIAFISYGDDNIFSVTSDLCGAFNQQTVSTAFASLGMTYTLEDKTDTSTFLFRPLESVTFLKRRFVFPGPCVCVPPLPLSTILEIPLWVRSKVGERELVIQAVEMALRELAYHDEGVYEHWSAEIHKNFRQHYVGWPELLPWALQRAKNLKLEG